MLAARPISHPHWSSRLALAIALRTDKHGSRVCGEEAPMGFRMRKSIRVARGSRLNVSKTGVAPPSAGRAHVLPCTRPAGARRRWVRESSRASTTKRAPAADAPVRPTAEPRPHRRSRGCSRQRARSSYSRRFALRMSRRSSRSATTIRFPRCRMELAGLQLMGDNPKEADQLLTDVFMSGSDPAEDSFVSKYLYTKVTLPIASGVAAGSRPPRRRRTRPGRDEAGGR